jgi:hypothetical protein
MKITIEIRDYEPGEEPDPLTIDRIEAAIDNLLANDGSDGTVIVTKEES